MNKEGNVFKVLKSGELGKQLTKRYYNHNTNNSAYYEIMIDGKIIRKTIDSLLEDLYPKYEEVNCIKKLFNNKELPQDDKKKYSDILLDLFEKDPDGMSDEEFITFMRSLPPFTMVKYIDRKGYFVRERFIRL